MAQTRAINPTYTTTGGDPSTDSSGNTLVSNATLLSGEDQTLDRLWGGAVCTYSQLAATGVVKASPGALYGVMPVSVGTSAVLTVYDNATTATGTALILAYTATALPNVSPDSRAPRLSSPCRMTAR